jgi:Rrf2 family protein
MLKLGKKTQYALVALFHLDRVSPGSRVSTHELSEHYGIPEPHLGKVLQKLSRGGLLTSVKGVQGGYELTRPLEKLRLGDVMQALEPAGRNRRLKKHTVLNAFPSCYVQGMAREVERQAIDRIYDMSLTDLLAEMNADDVTSTPPSLSPLEMSL